MVGGRVQCSGASSRHIHGPLENTAVFSGVRRSASSIAANPSTMPLPTGALVADHGLLFVRTHDNLPLRRAGFLAVRRDLSPRGRNVRAVIGSHSEFGKTCSGVRLATQARASQRVQRGTK
jgi:hypothetical protein